MFFSSCSLSCPISTNMPYCKTHYCFHTTKKIMLSVKGHNAKNLPIKMQSSLRGFKIWKVYLRIDEIDCGLVLKLTRAPYSNKQEGRKGESSVLCPVGLPTAPWSRFIACLHSTVVPQIEQMVHMGPKQIQGRMCQGPSCAGSPGHSQLWELQCTPRSTYTQGVGPGGLLAARLKVCGRDIAQ